MISVIIPTLNAASEICPLLDSLLSQTIPVGEIIIVDSTSDDGTFEIAQSYQEVVSYQVKRSDFNHGQTRHEAFLRASGEITCFMTQDALPVNHDFIGSLVAPFEDGKVAIVSGRQLPKEDARRHEQLVRAYNYGPDYYVREAKDIPRFGIRTFFTSDVCAAYRRKAYLQCGGFERVNTNEDMLMAARIIAAGYKIAYEPNAAVYHSHNLTFFQQYCRNKEIGFFLELHQTELADLKEIGEGVKLVQTVSATLLKEFRIGELFSFGADCAARFMGNRVGRAAAKRMAASTAPLRGGV